MNNFTLRISNRLTKLSYCLLITLIISLSGYSQNVGINTTGLAPNADAGLDVDFTNKGLLIPRVSLTSSTSFAPLSAHVAGMVVYNTATPPLGDVKPGVYYNDGFKWIAGFPTGNAIGDMLYWNGTAWSFLPVGTSGQYLQLGASNIPLWGTLTGGGPFATITTNVPTLVTGTTATSGAVITSDGGSAILTRGICYAINTNPTTGNSILAATLATGITPYSCNLTGLTPVTTYYVRAYATNSSVTTYGNEVNFTTIAILPTLAATTAAGMTGTTAIGGGNITSTGGATITERGICYGIAANPFITTNTKIINLPNPPTPPGTGAFPCTITGLTGSTTYHARSYAINSVGTAYGADVSFTTLIVPPTLVTVAATNISGASATSGATMNWNGGGYSNYQNYGIAYSTISNAANPTYAATNSSNGSVNPLINLPPWTSNLTGLAANTTYYIRSCINLYSGGWITVYGNELSFTTTAPSAPIITSTNAITGISDRTGISGGTITSDGGSPITVKGVCWSTSANPTLGVNNFTSDGTGSLAYVSNITGLTGNTLYYVRAYATNSIGTSYGPADVSFTTWVTAPYTIGQNLGYGYCAYVDATGHGFIVSYDIPSTVGWGCPGTTILTGTALGTGKANTALILSSCPTRPIAASIATSYNAGGFTDWYLPSSGEWALIAAKYTLFGFGGGYNQYYTSSAYSSLTYATTYFYTGSQAYQSGALRVPGVNDYVNYLRVIRDF